MLSAIASSLRASEGKAAFSNFLWCFHVMLQVSVRPVGEGYVASNQARLFCRRRTSQVGCAVVCLHRIVAEVGTAPPQKVMSAFSSATEQQNNWRNNPLFSSVSPYGRRLCFLAMAKRQS